MAGRTFAIGDTHGEPDHLARLLARFPVLDAEDTIVFLGDYLDRGPRAKELVAHLMSLPQRTAARVVCLRGNHEDAWLRVVRQGWDEFVVVGNNGCLATVRSFTGGPPPADGEAPTNRDMAAMTTGDFFPAPVVAWLASLPYWYEDQHAIYVHAGLPRAHAEGTAKADARFLHPAEVEDPTVLLWVRTQDFFRNYRGKRVVFGHTPTQFLPQELSSYTPEDSTDLFLGEYVVGTDTKCGLGGFLSAVELPLLRVHESR